MVHWFFSAWWRITLVVVLSQPREGSSVSVETYITRPSSRSDVNSSPFRPPIRISTYEAGRWYVGRSSRPVKCPEGLVTALLFNAFMMLARQPRDNHLYTTCRKARWPREWSRVESRRKVSVQYVRIL